MKNLIVGTYVDNIGTVSNEHHKLMLQTLTADVGLFICRELQYKRPIKSSLNVIARRGNPWKSLFCKQNLYLTLWSRAGKVVSYKSAINSP